MTEIKTYCPIISLREVVAYFWTATPFSNSSGKQVVRLMPDGKPGMIFQHRNGSAAFNNAFGLLPLSFLYGQATAHCLNYAESPASVFGVSFEPLALQLLFGFRASELTNRIIDLREFDKTLEERFMELDTDAQKIGLLSGYFLEKLQHRSSNKIFIDHGLKEIRKSTGQQTVNDLHKLYAVSERKFQRTFKEFVGITPIQYSRIIRFQRAVRQLQLGKLENHAALSYELGYADQSHYIREFKEFSGLTPVMFEAQAKNAIEHLAGCELRSRNTDNCWPVRIINHHN